MSEANAFSTFSERLVEFRRVGRLNRSALARAMGFANASTVQAWENGIVKTPRDPEDFYRRVALVAEAKPFARSPSPEAWARWLIEGGERPAFKSGPSEPPPDGDGPRRPTLDLPTIIKVRALLEQARATREVDEPASWGIVLRALEVAKSAAPALGALALVLRYVEASGCASYLLISGHGRSSKHHSSGALDERMKSKPPLVGHQLPRQLSTGA